MTKTLTEQWRDGTLEQRYYYVKYFGNGQKPFVEIELKNFLLDLVKVKDRDKIEILASVPSYEEWKNMDDLLLIYKEENKRLKAVKEHCENVAGQYADKLVDTERNVERLEKQLAIATKALKEYKEDYFVSEGGGLSVNPYPHIARKALKEMEEVK